MHGHGRTYKLSTTASSTSQKEAFIMAKITKVFFDIETLQTNTEAKSPRDRVVREYSVSMEYMKGNKVVKELFPSIKAMLDYLVHDISNRHFTLIAHNGRRFDFHFLRRTLLDDFGMFPVTGYKEDYTTHVKDHEYKREALDDYPNYLIEYRIKAKTSLDLEFKLGDKLFVTEDSLPHFQTSIKTIGELLEGHGIIEADGKKLNYEYDKYDVPYKVDDVRAYCNKIFAQLSDHELKYVHNDTDILRLGWYNYSTIFKDFDISKPTLSLNILNIYCVNSLARYQLVHKYKFPEFKTERNLQLSEYEFHGENFFNYVHHFYHGGLNFYNDRYVGHIVHDLVHIDINSSYPTVMYYEKFPTRLLEHINSKTLLKLDKDKYYLLQVPVEWVQNNVLDKIQSNIPRQWFVKYFPSRDGYVYIQSPHIDIFSAYTGKTIDTIPVEAALVYDKRYFGGREVIKERYAEKTQAKLEGWSKEAVYTTKVILNGIYGIPALRSNFNVFKYVDGKLASFPLGYKNSERDILFAAAVTAYALKNLLMPLSYNIKGLEKGYVYTDTDSHFLTKEYWETIKVHVNVHPTDLGAWDMEHKDIESMYVLNHKKYCLLNGKDEGKKAGKIEVFSGGISHDAFNTNMPFEEFVSTQFSDGCKIPNLKNSYTNDGVICLYMSTTEIKLGGKYPKRYSEELEIQNEILAARMQEMVLDGVLDEEIGETEDALYFENVLGSHGFGDFLDMVYNVEEGKTDSLKQYMETEAYIFDEIDRI